jgi:hypothetical protein
MRENLAEKLFGAVKDSLGNAPGEIAAELKQIGAHGAHELAAALFNGSSFVMYPRGSRDDQGVHGPGQEAPEVARESPEQSLGREM